MTRAGKAAPLLHLGAGWGVMHFYTGRIEMRQCAQTCLRSRHISRDASLSEATLAVQLHCVESVCVGTCSPRMSRSGIQAACVQVEHILAEKATLEQVDNPGFVNLYGSFQDDECIYLAMEFVPGGEFFSHLKSRKR